MTKKTFYNLDSSWVNNTNINLSAVERRTSTLTKRRTVKKEFQVAWLLKAITLIDLTTLSGDDTFGKVERLCNKALNPIDDYILQDLGLTHSNPSSSATNIKNSKTDFDVDIPPAGLKPIFFPVFV